MSVHEAVLHDLESLPQSVRDSALAVAALSLAAGLDNGYAKGSEAAAVARELRNHMVDLLSNVPSQEDEVGQIVKNRAARLAANSPST